MHFTKAIVVVAALFITSTAGLPVITSDRITEEVGTGVVTVPIQRRPWFHGHNHFPSISPSEWKAAIYNGSSQRWPGHDHHTDNLAPILPRDLAAKEDSVKKIKPRKKQPWWCRLTYPIFNFKSCSATVPTGTLREYY